MDHTTVVIRPAEEKEDDQIEVNAANRRANTAGCCGCIHEAAMYIEIALVVAAIVLVVLGATGVITWVYAGIGLVVAVAVAGAIGIAYNRAYIILGTLKALVDELQSEVDRLRGIVTNLEGVVNDLRGENSRYEQANVDHERILLELRREVYKQVEVNGQLKETLAGYQFALKKYESLVGVFESKIDATAKELAEQHKRVSEAATDLVGLEIRLESCLSLYDKNLKDSKAVAHRMELLLLNLTGLVDLDTKNLKDAEENEQTAAANLKKEEELNQRQEEMLNQQHVLLVQLTEVSNQLEKNTNEYEALNKDFDVTKEELEAFKAKIDGQSLVIQKVQAAVEKVLHAFNDPAEVQRLGGEILDLLRYNAL